MQKLISSTYHSRYGQNNDRSSFHPYNNDTDDDIDIRLILFQITFYHLNNLFA